MSDSEIAVMVAAVLIFLVGYLVGSRDRKTTSWERQSQSLTDRHRRNRAEHAQTMALAAGALASAESAAAAVVGVDDATKLLADFDPVPGAMAALAAHGELKPSSVPAVEAPIDAPPPVRLDVVDALDDALDVEPIPDDGGEVPRDESRVASLGARSDGDTGPQPPVAEATYRYAWPASAPTGAPARGVFPRGWGWMRRQAWAPVRRASVRVARARSGARVVVAGARAALAARRAEWASWRAERAAAVPGPHVGWQPGEVSEVTGGLPALTMPSPRLAAGKGVHRRKRIERERLERTMADTQAWTMPPPRRLKPTWEALVGPRRNLAGVR